MRLITEAIPKGRKVGLGMVNGEAMAASYPAHYEVPSKAAKQSIKIGDFLKVGLKWAQPDHDEWPRGESLLVQVTGFREPYVIIARVLSERVLCREFTTDSIIYLRRRHILEIFPFDDDYEDNEKEPD